MFSVQANETPSWKPKEMMERDALEGQCGLGFLPGIQEVPVLVPNLQLTPK